MHLCYGLTRIELSFLENHRSICVVIIRLELLGLTSPGLGLGSDYGYIICAYVTRVIIMVILILLVWRIGFGMTGSGTCRGDTGGSRLLSGAMLEACG
jgi:hypothetical protein